MTLDLLRGLVACALICISGCKQQIEDWRHGADTCQIHRLKMDTVVVNNLAGPGPHFTAQYHRAKEAQFPNCGIEYDPDLYGQKRGMILVCPDCAKAKENWRSDTAK